MTERAETLTASPGAAAARPRASFALGTLTRFSRTKPLGAFGGFLVALMLVLAVGAEWIAPYSYDTSVPGARMQPPGGQFWMGTDNAAMPS